MGSRPTVENHWTETALLLLDKAEIDSIGLAYCWDAIRDEMKRIEHERANPTPCAKAGCVKLSGHDGHHTDETGWNFV